MPSKSFGTCPFCGELFELDENEPGGSIKLIPSHIHTIKSPGRDAAQLKHVKRYAENPRLYMWHVCPGSAYDPTEVSPIGMSFTLDLVRQTLAEHTNESANAELSRWEHHLANTIQTWQPKPLMGEEEYHLREILRHYEEVVQLISVTGRVKEATKEIRS